MIKPLDKLGPGLLYAAAAVGVSHLVQSTRAGASYGLYLIIAVIVANIAKYPFFKIGPLYTRLTGESLLSGYKDIGKSTLFTFFLITLSTVFIIQAAVSLVTAGVAGEILSSSLPISVLSFFLLTASSLLIILGKYKFLDKVIKVIMFLLTVTTVAAVIAVLMQNIPKIGIMPVFNWSSKTDILFLVALIGWMPGPLDIPVWHSLWELENKKKSIKDTSFDFNVGYIGTAILAICFLMLGASVMYGSGEALPNGAVPFAAKLIEMFTSALGDWSYPLIAVCCFTTMFSTTITCLDAFSRVLEEISNSLFKFKFHKAREFFVTLVALGAFIIIAFFTGDMKSLIDLATTISFLVAPFFAFCNYKVMFSSKVPIEHRPRGFFKLNCLFGLLFLSSFTAYYLYIKL